MKNMLAKGFTLIELMVVLAIVGILTTVALPAAQDYLVRARVADGLGLAANLKVLIAENAAHGTASSASSGGLASGMTTGTATAQTICNAAGICVFGSAATPIDQNVVSTAVSTTTGDITVTYAARASGKTLQLSPASAGAPLVAGTLPTAPIVWTCYSLGKTVSNGQTNSASLLPRHAPAECR